VPGGRLLADRARPVLLVGTICPDRFDTFTRQSSSDSGRQDLGRDARKILGRWADRFDVMPTFRPNERDRARQIAKHDPRLAEAIRDPEDAHIAQTLAADPDLIRRWRNPRTPTVRP
jgi:hypothetical protein